MLSAIVTVGFALAAIAALYTIVSTLRSVMVAAPALKQALRNCPAEREVRFTIRETVTSVIDGKVVPLGARRAVVTAAAPLRAAA